LAAQAVLPWVNVQIIHNPEAGCIYFSERGCVQAHQPQTVTQGSSFLATLG